MEAIDAFIRNADEEGIFVANFMDLLDIDEEPAKNLMMELHAEGKLDLKWVAGPYYDEEPVKDVESTEELLEEQLSYFYDLMDILDEGLPYDLDVVRKDIDDLTAACRAWIDAHLSAECIGRGHEKYRVKLSLSLLLTELLEVFPEAFRNLRAKGGAGVQRMSLMVQMINRIEDLYAFVKEYVELPNSKRAEAQ